MPLNIKTCPTCGSRQIKRVRGPLKRKHNGRSFVVPNVEYFACPQCGEKLFVPAAMDKIQAASPAFAKPDRLKRVRKAG
jgi:YgiT-type zinc finger domain-containing protein